MFLLPRIIIQVHDTLVFSIRHSAFSWHQNAHSFLFLAFTFIAWKVVVIVKLFVMRKTLAHPWSSFHEVDVSAPMPDSMLWISTLISLKMLPTSKYPWAWHPAPSRSSYSASLPSPHLRTQEVGAWSVCDLLHDLDYNTCVISWRKTNMRSLMKPARGGVREREREGGRKGGRVGRGHAHGGEGAWEGRGRDIRSEEGKRNIWCTQLATL